MQQSDAVFIGFAHADDAAAAHGDSRLPDMLQRAQSVLVISRRDDLAVKLGGRIEIVVVGIQAGIGETLRLRFIQHAKRATYFQSNRRHASDHFKHRLELRTIADLAPGRTHAESRDSLCARFARRFHDVFYGKQILPVHARFIVRALRTIGAILRTPAGLDRQQLAKLYLARLKILTVHPLCREQSIEQARVIQGANFVAGPVVFQPIRLHAGIINGPGAARNLVGYKFAMSLRKEYVRILSIKIVEDLIKEEMLEVPEGFDLAEQLFQVMDAEINLEDRINDEVRVLLNQYQEQMRQSGASYQEMFKLIKNKLVRERKLVL